MKSIVRIEPFQVNHSPSFSHQSLLIVNKTHETTAWCTSVLLQYHTLPRNTTKNITSQFRVYTEIEREKSNTQHRRSGSLVQTFFLLYTTSINIPNTFTQSTFVNISEYLYTPASCTLKIVKSLRSTKYKLRLTPPTLQITFLNPLLELNTSQDFHILRYRL